MPNYRVLKKQYYSKNDDFHIQPIRLEDRYEIMKWRNEQIYHLRQNKLLSKSEQDKYFDNVVNALFDQSSPEQILFSYMEGNICIGYGGLVHINWIDKNAEISFIMNTALEKGGFTLHWSNFLTLIEEVAFNDLNLHKLYTYAFDLRPHLYLTLEKANYVREAVLKEHCYHEGKFINVIIHSKIVL